MRNLNLVYPFAVVLAVGTAILLDRMGVRSQWLASGFLVVGVVFLVIGVPRLPGAIRAGGKRALSVAAAALLGAGFAFIGVNTLWPSYRLDVVGYGLLVVSVILASWPQGTPGRYIGT
jgi:hypothetical protein